MTTVQAILNMINESLSNKTVNTSYTMICFAFLFARISCQLHQTNHRFLNFYLNPSFLNPRKYETLKIFFLNMNKDQYLHIFLLIFLHFFIIGLDHNTHS